VAIDAGLVIAQLVNFVLLLLLLRRFLFQPVARTMEERARAVADEIAMAERSRSEADAQRSALAAERVAFAEERRRLQASAERDAAALRELRMAELAADVQRERDRSDAERLRRDHDHDAALAARLAPLLAESLAVVMRELADDDLGRAAQRAFIARLQRLGESERASLTEAAQGGVLRLACAPLPPPSDAAALVGAIEGVVAHPVRIDFATDLDLIAGVALRAGDLRIEWSARALLRDLERAFEAALAPGAGGEPWNASA
jgi:F-type H+-transporting ATPase subunit b